MQKYENLSQRFLLRSFDYQKQFSHIYAYRLAEMTPLLAKIVSKHWGSHIPIKNLCDLREDYEEDCIIIGTIYKHQCHKPSILKEISEENQLAPQPQRENYIDAEDKVFLEDELQRVRLFGNVRAEEVATGVVCAVMGGIEEDGRFNVRDVMFYESGPQKPLQSSDNEKLLVLMSGLDQQESYNYVESLNMFQYWLNNKLNPAMKLDKVRFIIAGNSLRTRSNIEKQSSSLLSRSIDSEEIVNKIKALDEWFATWSSWIPIDLMPGDLDPANFMLPQQPFHHCMFPLARQQQHFQSVPNPYVCCIDDTLIVGTSGQNIKDIIRTTTLEKPIEALRNTLIWGHLTPTSPDTLACYPYVKQDPFIISECPHIYFTGNCDQFATELYEFSAGKRTRLICIPTFAKTQSIVVVNIFNLDCHEISFKIE